MIGLNPLQGRAGWLAAAPHTRPAGEFSDALSGSHSRDHRKPKVSPGGGPSQPEVCFTACPDLDHARHLFSMVSKLGQNSIQQSSAVVLMLRRMGQAFLSACVLA